MFYLKGFSSRNREYGLTVAVTAFLDFLTDRFGIATFYLCLQNYNYIKYLNDLH